MALQIVLLPGLLCDDAVWSDQRAAFGAFANSGPGADVTADRFIADRFIADRVVPGCVVPDYAMRDSIGAMADHALDCAHGERLLVAGHSMGGRVALEMFRRAPQRVAGLALLDTGFQARAAGDAGEHERAQRAALLELARMQGMRAMGEQWAPGMVHPDRLDSAVYRAILDMIARSTPAKFEAQIRALLDRPDAGALLETIDCPTLLVCGREDRWSPLARHEAMQARIRGSVLRVIEHSGHMSTMEQPQAVSEALVEWVKAVVERETRERAR
ncbi:alpha/beta fold hydrolase [Paraburkholderia acidisoli]|uniref:Alpha/beta fold hydrolase n=1 Tax=Paraburkholderia acidisoli TaxID=2571748 RepID=A0A7Z2GRU2_9BURK|nr:alpha/beta hydrolase [Paraburkholderia acidisoli]QGZ66768.1 alpha/beta fold hydrolase [Paraburkholderia acidisoli]